MVLNAKGQAFDVFKLLIAAVIALAILAVLWPIIQNLVLPGQGNPNQAASDSIKNSVVGILTTSKSPVNFEKEGVLSTKAVAGLTQQYSEGQVCISLGDYSGNTELFESGANYVRYAGSASKQVKLSVVCDTGTELESDLESAGVDSSWASDCECASSGDKCCLIALRFA